MKLEGQVGPRAVQDGTDNAIRAGRTGELIVADAHGRYAEAARRGRVFVAHNTAGQTLSVALATTYTGLCLSNPIGSNKYLELLGVGFALSAAPAAIASLHLIGGFSATAQVVHTTPLTGNNPQCTRLDGSVGATAKVDSAATIPVPQFLMPLSHGFTAAALPNHNLAWVDVGGLFVLAPGAFVCIGALTAVVGFAGFAWEEYEISNG